MRSIDSSKMGSSHEKSKESRTFTAYAFDTSRMSKSQCMNKEGRFFDEHTSGAFGVGNSSNTNGGNSFFNQSYLEIPIWEESAYNMQWAEKLKEVERARNARLEREEEERHAKRSLDKDVVFVVDTSLDSEFNEKFVFDEKIAAMLEEEEWEGSDITVTSESFQEEQSLIDDAIANIDVFWCPFKHEDPSKCPYCGEDCKDKDASVKNGSVTGSTSSRRSSRSTRSFRFSDSDDSDSVIHVVHKINKY